MTLLVFVARGQVGCALIQQARDREIGLVGAACNICDDRSVSRAFEAGNVSIATNCAVYTEVHRAENEHEQALAVNPLGAATTARAAPERGDADHSSFDAFCLRRKPAGRARRGATEARRSALDCGKIPRAFASRRPDWRISLSRVVASLEEVGI
jgi:dTDP-4-dehydrorhamnose reductase